MFYLPIINLARVLRSHQALASVLNIQSNVHVTVSNTTDWAIN